MGDGATVLLFLGLAITAVGILMLLSTKIDSGGALGFGSLKLEGSAPLILTLVGLGLVVFSFIWEWAPAGDSTPTPTTTTTPTTTLVEFIPPTWTLAPFDPYLYYDSFYVDECYDWEFDEFFC